GQRHRPDRCLHHPPGGLRLRIMALADGLPRAGDGRRLDHRHLHELPRHARGRRYRRSIMNSYHGWWSLGAVAGGLLGAASAQIELPLWSQGAAGLIIFGVLAALSLRLMLPGHDSTERPPAAGPSAASG